MFVVVPRNLKGNKDTDAPVSTTTSTGLLPIIIKECKLVSPMAPMSKIAGEDSEKLEPPWSQEDPVTSTWTSAAIFPKDGGGGAFKPTSAGKSSSKPARNCFPIVAKSRLRALADVFGCPFRAYDFGSLEGCDADHLGVNKYPLQLHTHF